VKVSQDQAFALGRPLLFALGPEKPGGPLQEVINIRNAGPGIAFNIRGVVFGHKPTNPHDRDSCLRNLGFANPLVPGESVTATNLQGMPKFRGNYKIGNEHREKYVFYAPERTPEEVNNGMVPILHRLTLTYHDIHGLKHVSIFDRTHLHAWTFVTFLPNIPKDIDDIEHEAK